jgi:hypothetical protein
VQILQLGNLLVTQEFLGAPFRLVSRGYGEQKVARRVERRWDEDPCLPMM